MSPELLTTGSYQCTLVPYTSLGLGTSLLPDTKLDSLFLVILNGLSGQILGRGRSAYCIWAFTGNYETSEGSLNYSTGFLLLWENKRYLLHFCGIKLPTCHPIMMLEGLCWQSDLHSFFRVSLCNYLRDFLIIGRATWRNRNAGLPRLTRDCPKTKQH